MDQATTGRATRLARAGWRWLQMHHMVSLGVAGIAAAAATLLFASVSMIASFCGDTCPGYAAVPGSIIGSLACLAALAALGAVGHWMGVIGHRTWLERLRLERAHLELDDDPDPRRRRLHAVTQPDGDVAAIHARGLTSLCTGLPVALAALMLLPLSSATFGDTSTTIAYLFPLVALAIVAATASAVRGWILLRAGRRLLEPEHRSARSQLDVAE